MSQQRDAPARPLYDHIEGIRIRRGWSKIRVAREAGIDRGTLNNWRTQPNLPTAESVKAVAEALGIGQEQALRLAGYPLATDVRAGADDSALAELRAEVAELRAMNAEQEERNAELRKRIEELAARQNQAKPTDDIGPEESEAQSGRRVG
jgi:transcriptional regulator with XRE-family HTH domain